MSKAKWFVAAAVAIVIGVLLFFGLRSRAKETASGDPEARIVAYLKENVKPGQPVLVTELYNNVFTSPEERDALQRLYDEFLKIPAAAAQMQMETGKIP